MPFDARPALLLRPSSVAVHDDRYVLRQRLAAERPGEQFFIGIRNRLSQ
jgi:hypothetical protein